MESPSCSTLTAGPLSLAAQTVMAALRAQYAGRIHRTRHMDSFTGDVKLSQNQDNYNYNPHLELLRETNVPHLGSSSLMERAVQSTQTIPTESSDYTKPPWRLLHEEKERRFYNHSPEMELPSQPAISLFQSKDNTFSQWETDEPGSLKLRDYGLDGSLLALNDNKITVSGNHILKIHTQSEEPFPMKDFSDWEDPQAVPDAIVVPEKQREISRTKKNIRLMCLSEDVFKAERVTRAPPRKRWCFGHLQMPAMSCSKDFIEEQKRDFGRQNREGSSKKMEADCFEGKMETVEGVMKMPKQRKDQEVGMSEKIQLNGLWSEGPDKESVVCGNGQKRNKLQPLLCHSHLKDITESSKRELLKSLDLADSSNFDHNTNELFRPSENNLQEPIQKVFYIPSFPLTSTKARGFDQGRMVRDDGSMYTVKEMEESGPGQWDSTCNKTDLVTPRPGERNVQMEAEVSIEQEDSAASIVPDTHTSHQELSQVVKRSPGVETKTVLAPKKPGKWKPPKPTQGGPKITLSQETCPKHGTSMPAFSSPLQQSSIPTGTKVKLLHQTQQSKSTELLHPHKGALALNERPEQNSTLQKKQKKQDTKTTNHSYISEFPKQKRSASEIDNQIHPEHPEGVKERYAISASSRLTLALPSDTRVCDASRLSQEERVCVLEEASRARALVVSMVYQDGTTQLDPEQKPLPAVCGLLVLLKKSLESLDLDQTGAAKERVLLLRLEQRPAWVQQDSQHNQDLFTREILLQMVLDPQIAAWLLDPADSAHCFQDLLSKHCSLPATHTPAQPALGHSKVTQAISNLSHLHRLMVELQNKLQTHGLWQLYFCMEQKMIPVLAAMESHSIHVDKENLKKTSDMLGNKVKQLEQEAHQAAGQQFLVSSSAQLRLNRRPRLTTPAQDLHIQHLHLRNRLRPATRTAAATIGLHNQRISAQTVRNRLREAHLHARHPHRGLHLTAFRRRNRLEWANAHIRWRLAHRRGVLFTDESRFSLYKADGRLCVWHCVGERFADINIVNRVAHGGGGVMLWAGVCYGQRTQVHFIDGILNAQRYRDKILRPMPFIHDHHLMLQHDDAWPHIERICTQFLEAENIPVLNSQLTHRTCHPLSMFGMLWIGVYDSVFQSLPISSNFT
ncbi:hypothetical protein SRHO_G00027760 [Serrasalmus rhombeus]